MCFSFSPFSCIKSTDSLRYVTRIGSCITCLLKMYVKSLTHFNFKPMVALFVRNQRKKRKPNIKTHQSLNRKYELLRLTYRVLILFQWRGSISSRSRDNYSRFSIICWSCIFRQGLISKEKRKQIDKINFHKTSQKDLVSTSFKLDSLCSACCNYFDRKKQFIVTASPGDNAITFPYWDCLFGY